MTSRRSPPIAKGKKAYTTLKSKTQGKSVLYSLSEEVPNYKDKLVLCNMVYDKKNIEYPIQRKFYAFEDVEDFRDTVSLPSEPGKPDWWMDSPHWLEVISGDRKQKPKFDIDVKSHEVFEKLELGSSNSQLSSGILIAGSKGSDFASLLNQNTGVCSFAEPENSENFDEIWRQFNTKYALEIDERLHMDLIEVINTYRAVKGSPESIALCVGHIVHNAVVLALGELYEELMDISNNILSFKSFNHKNLYKTSFHIVINNYCCANNDEALSLYEAVLAKFDEYKIPDFKQFVDSKVYSQTQQFRMYNNKKLTNTGECGVSKELQRYFYMNKSIYQTSLNPQMDILKSRLSTSEEKELAFRKILKASLVGYTHDCKPLKPLDGYIPPVLRNFSLDENDYDDFVLDLFNRFLEDEYPGCFKPCFYDGKGLRADRIKPSSCLICEHERKGPFQHESNAYSAYVAKDGWLQVMCYASERKGKLPVYDIEDERSKITLAMLLKNFPAAK